MALLAACTPAPPAPVDVDLAGTSPEAAALIRELRQGVEAGPRDGNKRGELGIALEANGLPRAAVRTYHQAEDLATGDPRWSYLSSVTLAQLGELDEALAAVDRSLALDPSYVPAHLYRGTWLFDLGRVDEARAAFEQATRLEPDNRSAWYGRARVHLRRHEGEQAVAILERLGLGRQPEPYLQQLLGLAYREQGDLERAREMLAGGRGERPPRWPDPRRRVLAQYARGYAAEKRRGDTLIEAGRWQDAVATLEPLLQQGPTDPDLLTNLALAHRNLGRHDESVRLLELGLEHHPDHVHLRVNLSVAFEQRGEFEQALQHLDRALELNPKLGFVHQRRGLVLMRLRRIEESVSAFERAVAHDSRDRISHLYLGMALAEAKRWSDAVERLELTLSLDPSNRDAMATLAIALAELGEFDRVDEVLTRLERLSPGASQVARLRERLEQKRKDAP
ncbi:MAG: tetratricopeptide repeat protein [Acidobacteria bacterium]|nr:tetratricopeptide repeat protein [Acidobacteriota bacterium]NIM61559.1 tetratricopeptide repeat protein [Acidobacteriota bacterium]NIQ84656.1 tetratricopeptide repeat protein [Acidobacteriota bacterium]NIT10556.1 tetratricopeptide repeat protein [Acidobacteriota bacterium]